jgi:hypothetical protein
MTNIEAIEQQISRLSPEELAQFREWYVDFDALVWDREIEADAGAGKLDALGDKAIRALASGRCSEP